jgi:hypothetical protein
MDGDRRARADGPAGRGPGGPIFYHTHGTSCVIAPSTPYGNDFAAWVAVQVRDQALSERLAVVNPFEFASVERCARSSPWCTTCAG